MSGISFSDSSTPPNDFSLEVDLGVAYPCYQKLMAITSSFNHAWNFSKFSGWMLKIYEHQKALFYLILLQDGYKISMAVRESERETFLQDVELKSLHAQLSAAKKYAEGYALQFEIRSESDFEKVNTFIEKLINLRRKG